MTVLDPKMSDSYGSFTAIRTLPLAAFVSACRQGKGGFSVARMQLLEWWREIFDHRLIIFLGCGKIRTGAGLGAASLF